MTAWHARQRAAPGSVHGIDQMLDIPALRGVPWLEPGDQVTAADLTAAQQAQQVQVGPGDLLFVRVGHRRRREKLGPWDAAARQSRHCRHCAGNCPGDCLLGDGQCIHGWNGKRPRELTWQVLLTRRWWDRVLWGEHGKRG